MVVVWACASDLHFAQEEVAFIESLRSPDFGVTAVDHSLRWDSLAALVGSIKPTIFHFIGHGDHLGNLLVPEERGSVARPAVDVIRIVRAASPSLTGVYLSGCFTTKPGPQLLEPLAPAGGWVVGTTSEIGDELATHFSKKFYEHLSGFISSPGEAFRVAQAYTEADWGDEVSHTMWIDLSSLPPVAEMAQTIHTALRQVFNRSAFRVSMRDEVSMLELDIALQDVNHALGTGEVLSRQNRNVIKPASFPTAWLKEPRIQNFIAATIRGVNATRQALKVVNDETHEDYVVGIALNLGPSASQGEWMRRINVVDRKRNQILRAANKLFTLHGLQPLPEISVSYSEYEIKQAVARR